MKKGVKSAKEQIKGRFACDDVRLLNEYVGCKIECDAKLIIFVLLQSFEDEFKCKAVKVIVPAESVGVLVMKDEKDKALSKEEQTHYRSGVGKLLHMMHWSIPEI